MSTAPTLCSLNSRVLMLQVYACVALYAAIFAICSCIKVQVYGLHTDPDVVNIVVPRSWFQIRLFELKRRRIQLDDEKVKSLECLKFQSYVQP